MKIATKKIAWIGIGALLTMTAGAPAVADDTELLLVTPGTNPNPFNANIMLIVDSSGSMGSIEKATEPYDSTRTYSGACDTTRMYWSRTGAVPSCDASNTQWVTDAAFTCKRADRQLDGIGLYQGILVQYRDDGTGGTSWNTLAAGANSETVECLDDSGFDGDPPDHYAQAGTNLAPYTSDAAREVPWGSYPATENYTVFDGNYINWRASPETIEISRIDMVKVATKTAMDSINSSNIGIMRFNQTEGGVVIQSLIDLDSNRTELATVIDGIDADGWTPLSETLYEAALYWLGREAHYGNLISEHTTDPAGLSSTTAPIVYAEPDSPVCTKNYNVLLSDGLPTRDEGGMTLAPTLPDFAAKLGRATCSGTGMGDCLDDIAEYLSLPDLSVDQKGDQFVTTHTIGFTQDIPILQNAAEASGGDYYMADDIEGLTLALLKIFEEANTQELAFTSPAVAVNTFNRTRNLNDLYMSVFNAENSYHWPGNLKKYHLENSVIVDANNAPAVDPATGFFYDSSRSIWTDVDPDGRDVESGGAAHKLPTPDSRRLFTNNGDSDLSAGSNAISKANAGAFTLADFGLTGATTDPTIDQTIDWLRGSDEFDEDANPSTTQRNAMGDPLHSQPAALVYGGSPGSEEVVVYTATNDGYLHAIDAATGVELWSFIPRELLSRTATLLFNPNASYKSYGIDGDVVPVFIDRDNNGQIDGSDFAYILFGMRRGGNNYYAIDVTDKNAPKLLWNSTYSGAGQSWSRPTVARVNLDDASLNADKGVVIIGAGYDPVHDGYTYPATEDNSGAAILMLDLTTGAELWRASRDVSADLVLSNMTRSFPSQVRVVDLDGDRFADRMYAADVGGQIWRMDIYGGQPASALVTGGVIAQIGAEGIATPSAADTRRTYNTPDVAIFVDNAQSRRFISVNIGTGYRAHPLDTSAVDAFYSFRDPDVFTRLAQSDYDTYSVATNTDFVEVAGSTQAVVTASDRGWKFTLPATEMVLSNSAVFNNEIFFVAFAPDTVSAADCSVNVGRNVLYRMSILNGDPIVDDLSTIADEAADAARATALQQGGIAPSPQFLFPSPDDPDCTGADCAPPPLGCVGVECFDPGFQNNPVRTLWTQDGIE